MELIGNILRIKNIINQGYLLYGIANSYTGKDIENKELMRSSDAFSIFGEETPIIFGNAVIVVPKGNAINKINALSEADPENSSEALQTIIDYFNNSFSEITKEEYEQMITYEV